LQILSAYTYRRVIVARILFGQIRHIVEVLDAAPVEAGVGRKFVRIYAMADHLGIGGLIQQMANLARHKVEHPPASYDRIASRYEFVSADSCLVTVCD